MPQSTPSLVARTQVRVFRNVACSRNARLSSLTFLLVSPHFLQVGGFARQRVHTHRGTSRLAQASFEQATGALPSTISLPAGQNGSFRGQGMKQQFGAPETAGYNTILIRIVAQRFLNANVLF
jgi:hypothetical protein